MKYDNETIKKILQYSSEGMSSRQIANILQVSKSGVNYLINRSNNRVNIGSSLPVGEGVRLNYIDIETLPCEALVFGRFGINLTQDHIIKNGGQIVSVCWMFEGDEEVSRVCMTPEEALTRDDSRVCNILYELLESVDIVVAQNGDRFDLPKIRGRFVFNGIYPPKTIKSVDTLKIARTLGFPSNRLDALGDYLGVGRKVKHFGIKLWRRCLEGDQEALNEMVEYNAQDVLLLRDVYMKIRAFDQRPPNAAHYFDDHEQRCPVCGSKEVHLTGNTVTTPLSSFLEYSCNDCGHRARGRVAVNSKDKRKSLLMTPR